jgi:hypothetical protein
LIVGEVSARVVAAMGCIEHDNKPSLRGGRGWLRGGHLRGSRKSREQTNQMTFSEHPATGTNCKPYRQKAHLGSSCSVDLTGFVSG